MLTDAQTINLSIFLYVLTPEGDIRWVPGNQVLGVSFFFVSYCAMLGLVVLVVTGEPVLAVISFWILGRYLFSYTGIILAEDFHERKNFTLSKSVRDLKI